MTAAPVSFSCGSLRLAGRLATPPAACGGAVICHPHPLYGGSMDNTVVAALEQALQAAGYATLAFNFRGVGGSDGGYGDFEGECDDARAALAFLRARIEASAVLLAGYSFGAMVALRVGWTAADVGRLIAVAPPLTMLPAPLTGACRAAKLIVVGDRDQYCPVAACERAAAEWSDTTLRVVPGADHFLSGFESAIETAVTRFIGAAAG